ncbi:hypothetical protein ACFVUZ_09000 [Kitasatospora sp. NPDC058060]|uniref:hypothetical protein n=1 Tax=Kitasatospora sp. NPDC058060 TaxID=3346318 RepID=UPI0036EC30CC
MAKAQDGDAGAHDKREGGRGRKLAFRLAITGVLVGVLAFFGFRQLAGHPDPHAGDIKACNAFEAAAGASSNDLLVLGYPAAMYLYASRLRDAAASANDATLRSDLLSDATAADLAAKYADLAAKHPADPAMGRQEGAAKDAEKASADKAIKDCSDVSWYRGK